MVIVVMLKRWKKILFCSFLVFCLSISCAFAQVEILCYHEIDKPNDSWSIDKGRFEHHLKYLQENGYHFVSLDEYINYTHGKLQLPPKSVMITFDDGYQSFYTKVYPLLKKYNVPAMIAIVSSWTDGEGKPTDVGNLATWQELREMEKSGLVTVVSHSHALHKNQSIDPQGDLSGIAESHLYINGHYETEYEYATRLNNDFVKGQEVFEKNLGHKARAIVWPYGTYSGKAAEIAMNNGMEATFLLDGGTNSAKEANAKYARRVIISKNTDTKRLEILLTKDNDAWNSKPIRMAQIDIDNLYDKNPEILRDNIKNLVDRLNNNKISLVAVQAFADSDGDGMVDKVYFYNHEIPIEADVFTTVTNALLQENIEVVAWMPSLNFMDKKLFNINNNSADNNTDIFFINPPLTNKNSTRGYEAGWYNRRTPFNNTNISYLGNKNDYLGNPQNYLGDKVYKINNQYYMNYSDYMKYIHIIENNRLHIQQYRNKLEALYRDLSRYSAVNGILFQDDLYMNDFEGKAAYQNYKNYKYYEENIKNKNLSSNTPIPLFNLEVLNNPTQAIKWAHWKTKSLTDLSLKLASAFKENRPNAVIMRDIYSDCIRYPEKDNPKTIDDLGAEYWFSQNYKDYLKNYDYTVIMAYPYMDKEDDPLDVLTDTALKVKAANGIAKSIIKIQTYDWDKEDWLSKKIFDEQIATLKKSGIKNIGYYPDTYYLWAGK